MPSPTKPPPRAEYKVVLIVLAVLFIIAGLAALVAGLMTLSKKHDIGVLAIHLGLNMLGFGGFLLLALWLINKLLDED